MSQSALAKTAFKTTYRHRKISALLTREKPRPAGYRQRPVLVRLAPLAGLAPSDKPPVRIFLGTEPAQYRAERVFVWSVLQVRDPARTYEIHIMKDLAGFDRSEWKTGFTNYRYAIPALAGGSGRAIYNDVDQIYLADPAELFDSDMRGAGLLSIDDRETSVMLLDCAKMIEVWTLGEAQTIHKHKYFRTIVHDAGLWGYMAAAWNARDFEYVAGQSKLLHFTTLHKQPWQPFPGELKYEGHDLAGLWRDMERAADAAGFEIFTKERPSERYQELLQLYRRMHEVGRPESGHGPEVTYAGKSLTEHIEPIARLVRETGARTILDYGSGKAGLYRDSPEHEPGSRYKVMDGWEGATITCYDPGYEPFATPYEGAYDGVITTDVLEHIPEEDIGWVLEELFAHARRFVYAAAACHPAQKFLPDGSNAHCTVQTPEWWRGRMEATARRYPGVKWMLCTQEKSALAFHQRKKLTKKGIRLRFFAGAGPAAAQAL